MSPVLLPLPFPVQGKLPVPFRLPLVEAHPEGVLKADGQSGISGFPVHALLKILVPQRTDNQGGKYLYPLWTADTPGLPTGPCFYLRMSHHKRRRLSHQGTDAEKRRREFPAAFLRSAQSIRRP